MEVKIFTGSAVILLKNLDNNLIFLWINFMIKNTAILLLVLFTFFGCNKNMEQSNQEATKNEIVQTEKAFAEFAKTDGVTKAFYNFAADDAAINRGNSVIKGKEKIKEYYENQTLKEIKLDWTPDFVDVSESGDLGYTYGHYTFSAIDTNGKTITSEGIFHTVWKKQKDGTWKFVWD